MSTDQGVLRHETAHMANAGMAALPTNDETTALDELKSKVTFIWNPLADINLVGPDGLIMRLGKGRNFYGQGRPRETLEDYLARGGDRLRRCFMYPVWNIDYIDTVANTGDFTEADAALSKTEGRFQSKLRMVERRQFAGVCAADFISRYGESHGAKVLTPLLGMDGPETSVAEEIFKLVQPVAYKLTSPYDDDPDTLLHDLTYAAPLRIAGADLEPALEKKAEQTRLVMRAGVVQAIKSAKESIDSLDQSMADAKLARPGKSRPTPTDEHICFLLGEAVPAAVVRPPREGVGTPSAGLDQMQNAIAMLAENQLRQSAASGIGVDTAEARAVIAEIRAEREALQRERELLAQERAADVEAELEARPGSLSRSEVSQPSTTDTKVKDTKKK